MHSSLDLSPALVQRLESELVASHNRFVCLLLASMAREQLGVVAAAVAAAAAGDAGAAARLHEAARLHFATLEVGGQLVAGAVLYPRASSQKGGRQAEIGAAADEAGGSSGHAAPSGDGSSGPGGSSSTSSKCGPADPHLYIELITTNQRGKGWGSLLLQHIERFAVQHAAGLVAAPGGQPLLAIKLLSVSGAQRFYEKHQYYGPDQHTKEMHKLLSDVAV